MIDQSLFKDGWYQQSLPRERSAPIRWGVERLGVGFISQKNGVAGQAIYRGGDFDETRAEYLDRISTFGWFYLDEDVSEWYIPSDFTYESTIADNYRFGCQIHNFSDVQSCQFVGQYGVYLTRFRTHMSDIMTYQDLEQILDTIDNKMAQCLGK